jgi:DNA-binding transcriptional ArsR family regulator
VVSKKIETPCCCPAPTALSMPPSVASGLTDYGGIRGLTQEVPSETRLKKEAKRHQSLADHTRLKILWAISKMDLCPCVLKVVAGVSDSKLSYHLRVLEEAGMVRSRRIKNWMLYSVTNLGLENLGLEHD